MNDTAPIDLSVVLPVYNEQECLEEVVAELAGVLDTLEWNSEIVAVDDGSSDASPSILSGLSETIPQLRVIALERNGGQSMAFAEGFRQVRGEWVLTLDADGQNDPADIPRLIENSEQADAVVGFRANRQDPVHKRWGSRLAKWVRNSVLSEEVIDTGCSLKLFRSRLVRDLEPWDGYHRFFPTLFMMQGARLEQIPVGHRHRAGGTSKYGNLSRLVKTVPHLFYVRRLKKDQAREASQTR